MSSSPEPIVVAIDGPSASGKSTVARGAARTLDFNYVDSGSYYRGLTWKCLRDGIDISRTELVLAMLLQVRWETVVRDRSVTFLLDGEEPGDQLRAKPVQERVSDIAAIPEVRTFVVGKLREATRFGHLVMEGRDIGTVVFPDTPFKFYLDAAPEERARRRYKELAGGGYEDVQNVLDSLKRRDHKDSTRKTAPLQIALGAKIIDSTQLDSHAVVELVVAAVRGAGIPQP